MGGLVPGSSGAGSREIFHDGLRLPPVRYQTAAGIERAIEAMLRANSRTPDVVIGDLRGAGRRDPARRRAGSRRSADEYGRGCVLGVMGDPRSHARAGSAPSSPPGRTARRRPKAFSITTAPTLDRPVRIAVRARKAGDRLTLDLSGYRRRRAGPVNVRLDGAVGLAARRAGRERSDHSAQLGPDARGRLRHPRGLVWSTRATRRRSISTSRPRC